MGGHALSEGLTERKSLKEYLEIKSQVLHLLRNHASHIMTVNDIIEMPGKESFGDLDLLYVREEGVSDEQCKAAVQEIFSPSEMRCNGTITSIDFQRFQIDFIECTPTNFRMSQFCLNFGDRGMILGRIARSRGLSLGVNGLTIPSLDVERIIGENLSVTKKVVLSTDPDEIRAYMGLWPTDNEINTPEDVARFCRSCSWYAPELFIRRVNQETRKKWKNRPFYKKFVEDIHKSLEIVFDPSTGDPIIPAEAFSPSSIGKCSMRGHQEHALTHFNKWDEIERLRMSAREKRAWKQKFNGGHLCALGVRPGDVDEARCSFLQWLQQQKDAGCIDATLATPATVMAVNRVGDNSNGEVNLKLSKSARRRQRRKQRNAQNAEGEDKVRGAETATGRREGTDPNADCREESGEEAPTEVQILKEFSNEEVKKLLRIWHDQHWCRK